MPLENKESFALDGVDYEAFNTSGGLGTLCETLAGKVRNLDYKSVRYPGHCDIAKLLVRDLGLSRRQDLLKEILDEALPHTLQDVVIIFVTVSGMKGGKLCQESFAKKIYAKELYGKQRGAIQITTAASACAVIDLMQDGKLPAQGFIKQEQVRLDDFLSKPIWPALRIERLVNSNSKTYQEDGDHHHLPPSNRPKLRVCNQCTPVC